MHPSLDFWNVQLRCTIGKQPMFQSKGSYRRSNEKKNDVKARQNLSSVSNMRYPFGYLWHIFDVSNQLSDSQGCATFAVYLTRVGIQKKKTYKKLTGSLKKNPGNFYENLTILSGPKCPCTLSNGQSARKVMALLDQTTQVLPITQN